MNIYKPTPSEIVTKAFVAHCCDAYQMDHNGFHGFDRGEFGHAGLRPYDKTF